MTIAKKAFVRSLILEFYNFKLEYVKKYMKLTN